jgi:hypothetical protein
MSDVPTGYRKVVQKLLIIVSGVIEDWETDNEQAGGYPTLV